jgi:thioredoxin 1
MDGNLQEQEAGAHPTWVSTSPTCGGLRFWAPSRMRLGRRPRAPQPGRMATSTLAAVGDDTFAADVLASPAPVLVDFTASWCPPCRAMEPVLEQLAAARDDLRVVQLDVDAHPATAARHGILSMPTFVLFREGEPVLRLVGARPLRRLERELAEALEQG